jgi:hypothetical protein
MEEMDSTLRKIADFCFVHEINTYQTLKVGDFGFIILLI